MSTARATELLRTFFCVRGALNTSSTPTKPTAVSAAAASGPYLALSHRQERRSDRVEDARTYAHVGDAQAQFRTVSFTYPDAVIRADPDAHKRADPDARKRANPDAHVRTDPAPTPAPTVILTFAPRRRCRQPRRSTRPFAPPFAPTPVPWPLPRRRCRRSRRPTRLLSERRERVRRLEGEGESRAWSTTYPTLS